MITPDPMDKTLQDARWLWEQCFPEDDSLFLDFYFSEVAQAQDTYIDYDESGRPIAHIGILRYAYEAKPNRSLAYISGACTLPEARQQGLMKQLMTRVIKEEKERGSEALILIPADEDLRRYYSKHFGFVDTAPYLSLAPQEYAQYLDALDPKPLLYSDATEALEHTPLSSKHICYTREQCQAIIEEYSRFPIGIFRTSSTDQGIRGLLLARHTASKLYIDCLIGDKPTRQSLLADLQSEYPDLPCQVQYLFPDEYPGRLLDSDFAPSPRPWGMALPLKEEARTYPWECLGISLVHN